MFGVRERSSSSAIYWIIDCQRRGCPYIRLRLLRSCYLIASVQGQRIKVRYVAKYMQERKSVQPQDLTAGLCREIIIVNSTNPLIAVSVCQVWLLHIVSLWHGVCSLSFPRPTFSMDYAVPLNARILDG